MTPPPAEGPFLASPTASAAPTDRSDVAPASTTLLLGARRVVVPLWWAEARGYAAGTMIRPEDAALAEEVSAAARGGLAALDRATARRGAPLARPAPRGLPLRAALTVAAIAAAVSAAVTLATLRGLGLLP